MGAFFFVRREVFEELGGFDERFFVYFEEVDFSLRAMRSGWRSMFLSDAQAFHSGAGTTENIKARRLFYSLRSRIQYGYKHFGLLSATLMVLVTLLVEPASRMTWAMAKSGWRDVAQTAHAYLMLWGSLPKMLINVLRSSRSASLC
jgi:GT2 family glycosyltransferase